MKLYTRRGDDGWTDLHAGGRVPKSDPRMRCIGEVDETNAAIGFALVVCESGHIRRMLEQVQARLFELGADLATADDSRPRRVQASHVNEMEKWIDQISGSLAPLKHFILPGGCELSARLHLARTVCRRAERASVDLFANSSSTSIAVTYLNRLSDLLFVLARLANQQAGIDDVPWHGE
ncbi:MAG: cob(I)yrinic acid a,c-diamide adenosyltransferase [Gammaproteobacteria bacterium]|nr:MAG: cob(I)yrinic acid a,c-diamide adenosyltransferase [Gammaproteobacteria bacterium]